MFQGIPLQLSLAKRSCTHLRRHITGNLRAAARGPCTAPALPKLLQGRGTAVTMSPPARYKLPFWPTKSSYPPPVTVSKMSSEARGPPNPLLLACITLQLAVIAALPTPRVLTLLPNPLIHHSLQPQGRNCSRRTSGLASPRSRCRIHIRMALLCQRFQKSHGLSARPHCRCVVPIAVLVALGAWSRVHLSSTSTRPTWGTSSGQLV